MANLNLITSNPVMDSYDARTRQIDEQRANDLQNAINEQAYQYDHEANPLRKRSLLASVTSAERENRFGDTTFDNRVTQSNNEAAKSGVDLSQAQENLDYTTRYHPLDLRSKAAEATGNESDAVVKTATQGNRIAATGYDAEGKRLGNLQLVTSIDHGNTDWNQKQLAGKTQVEEDGLLAVALDPVNGPARASAAGANVPQEYLTAIQGKPWLAHAVADYITQLRSIPGADADFRYNEFKQNIASILQRPVGEIPSAVAAAVASAKQRAPKTDVDPLWKNAIEQAGKELNEQFFADPNQRASAIDARAKDIYRTLRAGPSAEPPAAAPQTDAATPATPPASGWSFWGQNNDGAGGVAALAGPQALPQLPNGGGLDRAKLVKGAIYNMPGVGRVRFNGQAFEAMGQ